MRWNRRICVFIGAMAAVAWCGSAAQSQDAAGGEAAAAGAIEPDMAALLYSPSGSGDLYADMMYRMTPPEGRQMLMVPFRVNSISKDVKLDTGTLTLATGRLVAWYIPYDAVRSGPQRLAVTRTAPSGLSITMKEVPTRLARELTLTADGRIKWPLPVTLTGFVTTDEHNAYVMKVNRTALKPPVQELVKRADNEAPADFMKRRNEAVEAYRREREAYTLRIKAVGELPTSFDEPAPDLIWAVFEASQLIREVKLTGPPPLPWKANWEVFLRLQRLVRNQLPADAFVLSEVVKPLFAERQVLSDRAIAVLIAQRDNLKHVAPGSELAAVVEKLVAQGDAQTRLTLVRALALNSQAPTASALLLRAAADPDPGVSLLSMKARVASAGPEHDAAFTAKLADNASRLLALPDAVGPTEVLTVPIDLSGKQADAVAPLTAGVKLLGTHARRQDEMLQSVLAWASERRPLAEAWVDTQLLGGADAAVTGRTLALIDDPNTPLPGVPGVPGAPGVGETPEPAATDARADAAEAATPAPGAEAAEAAEDTTPAPAGEAAAGEPAAAEVIAVEAAPAENAIAVRTFYLSTPDHAIVKLLSSPDEPVRRAAWTALLRFRIAPPGVVLGDAGASAATDESVAPVYAAVAAAAIGLDPTPVDAVRFFATQADAAARQSAITRIMFDGKGPARAAALRWLATLGKVEFANAFLGLNVAQRIETAKLWYASDPAAIGGSADDAAAAITPLLDLLGHPNIDGASAPVIGWFADRIVSGDRPTARDWAGAMANEEAMVDGLLGDDKKVARACAAAMIALAAWPTDPMIDQLLKMVQTARRESTDPAVVKPKVVGLWAETRKQLERQVAQAAAGPYAVTMTIIHPRDKDASPIDGPPAPVVHSLGGVTLAVTLGEPDAAEHPIEMTPPHTTGAVVANPSGLRLDKADLLLQGAAEEGRPVINWPTEATTLALGPRGVWVARIAQSSGAVAQLELRRAAK